MVHVQANQLTGDGRLVQLLCSNDLINAVNLVAASPWPPAGSGASLCTVAVIIRSSCVLWLYAASDITHIVINTPMCKADCRPV